MGAVHKILQKDVMPDGTNIQIEDWKEVYPFEKTVKIGAYPLAKNSGRHGWIQRNEKFRLELSRNFNSDKEVYSIYEALTNGSVKLEDLDDHYYHGDRDRFYLGLIDDEPYV